jgi:hypothetical protein
MKLDELKKIIKEELKSILKANAPEKEKKKTKEKETEKEKNKGQRKNVSLQSFRPCSSTPSFSQKLGCFCHQ